jgi:Predicted permease
MKEYPTLWQRKMMWAALTACFVVVLVVIVAAVIWAGASIISFLQPILIPVAIAAILAYLLDPLVTKMSRGTLTRTKAIALLFELGFLHWADWQHGSFRRSRSEREFRQANPFLHRTGSELHRRSYLSVRPDIRVGGRRTDEIRVEKSYQFPDRPGAISFSPPTDDGESDRIAATHAPPTQVIAPTQPKLSSAERQRIQAYVEKQMPSCRRRCRLYSESCGTF